MGITVIMVVAIETVTVGPSSAAAPWIMMVTGSSLSQPVKITSFDENAQILTSLNTPVNRSTLQDRPALQLWLYWGPSWEHYVDQGGSLSALRPDEATQRGTFYPATKTQPAVMELVGSGRGPLIVDPAGIVVLSKVGVPTTATGLSGGTPPPNPGAPPGWAIWTMFALVLGLILLVTVRKQRTSTET